MKQRIYILIAVFNIIIYLYLLLFAPKIETYSYERYKSMMESTGEISQDIKEQLAGIEIVKKIHIENITDFSDKYEGEIPLSQITTRLNENINEKFKFLAEESLKKDYKTIYQENKQDLYKYMGISQIDVFEKMLNKISALKNDNVEVIKAEIKNNSLIISEKDTEFILVLYLNNSSKIELNIKVNNFLKDGRPVLVVE